jgi:hypothetical protein
MIFLLFLMALFALNRTFFLKIMARDADSVRGLFSPTVDLARPLLPMAVKALVVQACLVLPVLELEHHDPHFEVDDIWTVVFRRICQNRCRPSRDGQ